VVAGHTGNKVDEMMAETPEHLSDMGDEDRKAGGDTGKQSSPQKAAEISAEHPTSSDKKSRQTKEQRSDKKGSQDEGPSGQIDATPKTHDLIQSHCIMLYCSPTVGTVAVTGQCLFDNLKAPGRCHDSPTARLHAVTRGLHQSKS